MNMCGTCSTASASYTMWICALAVGRVAYFGSIRIKSDDVIFRALQNRFMAFRFGECQLIFSTEKNSLIYRLTPESLAAQMAIIISRIIFFFSTFALRIMFHAWCIRIRRKTVGFAAEHARGAFLSNCRRHCDENYFECDFSFGFGCDRTGFEILGLHRRCVAVAIVVVVVIAMLIDRYA